MSDLIGKFQGIIITMVILALSITAVFTVARVLMEVPQKATTQVLEMTDTEVNLYDYQGNISGATLRVLVLKDVPIFVETSTLWTYRTGLTRLMTYIDSSHPTWKNVNTVISGGEYYTVKVVQATFDDVNNNILTGREVLLIKQV